MRCDSRHKLIAQSGNMSRSWQAVWDLFPASGQAAHVNVHCTRDVIFAVAPNSFEQALRVTKSFPVLRKVTQQAENRRGKAAAPCCRVNRCAFQVKLQGRTVILRSFGCTAPRRICASMRARVPALKKFGSHSPSAPIFKPSTVSTGCRRSQHDDRCANHACDVPANIIAILFLLQHH